MKRIRILTLLLIVAMVICNIPFTASAATAQVTEIDGEITAFLGTFGKVSYNGKSYASFKTFDEALNALGKEGGRIVLSGNISIPSFNDIEGRQPLTIVGIGKNAKGNLITFTDMLEINLKGDLSLGNVNIRTAPGAYILTNGNKLETFDNFDTYNVEKYVEAGDNIITYPDPPSLAPGKVEKESAFSLTSGKYDTVLAGSANGADVNANSYAILDGAEVQTAIVGNSGNGILNANASIRVNNSIVTKLVAGSEGGTVNGNLSAVINGGSVSEIILGASSGATVNGNIVLSINGGAVGKLTSGSKPNGKTIIMLDSTVNYAVDEKLADYFIKIDGGICEPVFEGTILKGFKVSDIYGIPSKEITVNGEKLTSDSSVYQLQAGTVNINVETAVSLGLNRYANYVNGYEDGTFLPQNNMTKAEAVTLLSRLLVDENYIKGNISANFSDVEPGAWYESYIGFFDNLGFLDLVTEDYGLKFAPTKNITRSEFTQLVYELASYENDSASTKIKYFSDVNEHNPHLNAINFAVSNGIVTGYEDGSFKPDNSITRAEVVTMVNRLLGRIPNGVAGNNNFSDISTHWANGQILAACNPENVSWTAKTEENSKYIIKGNTAKDYVIALYEQSATLSADAIREGVDIIAEQMKKDILSAPDNFLNTGKKTYYISEKNGNDDNDGLSPETAFKTPAPLSRIKFLRNATVLFERGGIYRGQIQVSSGMEYGAYGTGDKPLLMQSKRNYADESLWVETEYPNVYKCTELLSNVGIIGFDHDLFDYSKDSYDEKYGLIMNKGVLGFTGVQDMNKDLQFYSAIGDEDISTPCALYIYSTEGNPGKRFTSIEMGEKYDIFDGTPVNVKVENLAFKFTGAHAMGMNAATQFYVTNCVFSWLGGSILSNRFGTGGTPVNYGNAIETGTCNGYYLDNNWMYQLYDTGVTHQCSEGTGSRIQKDIRYSGNLIEYVHWGIEFYNNPNGAMPTDVRYTEDVYDAYNVLRFGGYGWGSIVRNRQGSAQLYSGYSLSENRNQLTEYNIFDRCAGNLLVLPSNSTEVQDKNIYIQTIGKNIGILRGTSLKCSYNVAFDIDHLWGDKNAVVIVIDPEKEDPAQYNK